MNKDFDWSVAVCDTQCYYEHGHWVGALERFGSLAESFARVSFVVPHWAIDWLPAAPSYPMFGVQNNFLTYRRGLTNLLRNFLTSNPLVFALEVLRLQRRLKFNSWIFPTGDNFARNLPVTLVLLLFSRASVALRFVGSESCSYWPVGIRLLRFLGRHRLRIAVEADFLAKAFVGGVTFDSKNHGYPAVVPYPTKGTLQSVPSSADGVPQTRSKSPRGITYGLLGAPRKSKGYIDYERIIRSICTQTNSRVIVQCMDADIDLWSEKFKAFSDRITLLPSLLSSQELSNSLDQVDVVLLPYDRYAYRKGSSAMLMEAAERGSALVVTEGTGISSMVERWNLGLSNGGDWKFDELEPKILELLDSPTFHIGLESFNKFRNESALLWMRGV